MTDSSFWMEQKKLNYVHKHAHISVQNWLHSCSWPSRYAGHSGLMQMLALCRYRMRAKNFERFMLVRVASNFSWILLCLSTATTRELVDYYTAIATEKRCLR